MAENDKIPSRGPRTPEQIRKLCELSAANKTLLGGRTRFCRWVPATPEESEKIRLDALRKREEEKKELIKRLRLGDKSARDGLWWIYLSELEEKNRERGIVDYR